MIETLGKPLTAEQVRQVLDRAARIEKALDVIQSGFEYINGDPKMDGTFEQHPHLINRQRMMEIAREALGDE